MNNNDSEKKIPPYFKFYTKYCSYFDCLTEIEAGKIIKYICDYVQDKAEPLSNFKDSPTIHLLLTIITQEIDNGFKKYWTQCENGKKGGAPKNNKNAAKNKAEDTHIELNPSELETYKQKYCEIIANFFEEAEEDNYSLEDYFSLEQTADIITCFVLLDVNCYDEYQDDFEIPYKKLIHYIDTEGAKKFLKELKEVTKNYYFYQFTKADEKDYNEEYSEYKRDIKELLKYPYNTLKKVREYFWDNRKTT